MIQDMNTTLLSTGSGSWGITSIGFVPPVIPPPVTRTPLSPVPGIRDTISACLSNLSDLVDSPYEIIASEVRLHSRKPYSDVNSKRLFYVGIGPVESCFALPYWKIDSVGRLSVCFGESARKDVRSDTDCMNNVPGHELELPGDRLRYEPLTNLHSLSIHLSNNPIWFGVKEGFEGSF